MQLIAVHRHEHLGSHDLRRRAVGDRYDKLVNALYSGQDECHIETEVTFEDGRTGMLSADVRICDAEVYPAGAGTEEVAA